MKKLNKKGFQIVELVIAVIAILSAVLIPIFSGVVEKTNESNSDVVEKVNETAALQDARNEYTLYLAENAQNGTNDNLLIEVKNNENKTYYFEVQEGQFKSEAKNTKPEGYSTTDVSNSSSSSVKIYKKA